MHGSTVTYNPYTLLLFNSFTFSSLIGKEHDSFYYGVRFNSWKSILRLMISKDRKTIPDCQPFLDTFMIFRLDDLKRNIVF